MGVLGVDHGAGKCDCKGCNCGQGGAERHDEIQWCTRYALGLG